MSKECYVFEIKSGDYKPGTFVLVGTEGKRLCENSIERVINTAINVVEDSDHCDAVVLLDDLMELKCIIILLWVAAQSAEFARNNNIKD